MKVFINKGILFKLIACLCIFLTLFNFTGTMQVYAAEQAEQALTGGKLLTPVLDLLMTIGDGIVNLIQNAIMGTSATVSLDIKGSILVVVLAVLAAIIAGIIIIAITGGVGAFLIGIKGVVASVVGFLAQSGAAAMLITGVTIAGVAITFSASFTMFKAAFLPDYTVIPSISVSPEEIFSGRLLVFDVNFFNPKQIMVAVAVNNGHGSPIVNGEGDPIIIDRVTLESWDESHQDNHVAAYYYFEGINGDEIRTSKQSSSATLSRVISRWYYTIRNISIVVLMLILLYVGIRMLLTSIASEKSKYKKMLGDWVVAICLVFVLHYIMVFAVNLNDNIISVMRTVTSQDFYVHLIQIDDSPKSDRLVKAFNDAGLEDMVDNDSKVITIPTNLMGKTRLMAQKLDGTSDYVGYAIAYIVLVMYTVFFAFTYLKRVLMMAFLTVIAPLVAVTYPIDKISDGHAQAFNTWLKEYIFNLLIQPVHLLLYILLISMAFELSSQNIIYTLVAIGFMIPAEKFVRSMFGFDKAKTPGFLAGAAGAALTMTGIQALSRLGNKLPHGHPNNPNSEIKGGDDNDSKGIYSRSANSGNGFENLLGTVDSDLQDDSFETKLNIGNQQSDNKNDNGPDNLVNNPNNENVPMDADLQDNPLDRGNQGLTDEEQLEYDALNDELGNIDYNEMYLNPELYEGKKARLDELQQKKDNITNQPTSNGRRLNTENAIRLNETNANPVITMKDIEDVENAMNGGSQPKEDENPIDPAQARRNRLNELKNSRPTWKGAKKQFKSGLKSAGYYLKNPKTYTGAIAKTLKGTGRVMGTVTGATIGLASGIASGDVSSAFKNAAIGATSGNVLSGAVSDMVANPIDNSVDSIRKARTEYEKERYGSNYSEYKKLQQDEKFKKDKEARDFYATEFASELNGLEGKEREEKLNNIMEDAIKYREYGVTDNEKIIKAMNLDKNNRTSKTSIASALMATKATDLKSVETYQSRLSKQVGESQAEKIAEGAMKINGIGFSGGSKARQNSTQQQRAQQRQSSTQRQGPGRPRKINRTQPQSPNSPPIRTQPPAPGPDNN